jgi:nicotinamide-nucleotide amidase
MSGDETERMAARVLDACRERKLKVVTAESCTGGLVAGALTDIAGSSDVVDRGYITYSNRAKQDVLGVSREVLQAFGAVSMETAEAMARGALKASGADLAVAVTGIAGPGGGSPDKPVGLVHFATASRSGKLVHLEQRFGNIGRNEVRKRSVLQAIGMLHDLAEAEMANPSRTAG